MATRTRRTVSKELAACESVLGYLEVLGPHNACARLGELVARLPEPLRTRALALAMTAGTTTRQGGEAKGQLRAETLRAARGLTYEICRRFR